MMYISEVTLEGRTTNRCSVSLLPAAILNFRHDG